MEVLPNEGKLRGRVRTQMSRTPAPPPPQSARACNRANRNVTCRRAKNSRSERGHVHLAYDLELFFHKHAYEGMSVSAVEHDSDLRRIWRRPSKEWRTAQPGHTMAKAIRRCRDVTPESCCTCKKEAPVEFVSGQCKRRMYSSHGSCRRAVPLSVYEGRGR
jgi:hypothetical protein